VVQQPHHLVAIGTVIERNRTRLDILSGVAAQRFDVG